MKKLTNLGIIILFAVLCAAHIYLFVSGISLGDQINQFGSLTKKLDSANLDLEKKLYSIESLSYAASQAAILNFSKKAQPVYLDNLAVALKR